MTQKDITKYYSAFTHFSLRLKERFGEDITIDEYIERLVLKRTLPKKYNGKYIKRKSGDKVYVYGVNKHFEIPITVYKLNKIHNGSIFRTI
jgi:hypothetical protein